MQNLFSQQGLMSFLPLIVIVAAMYFLLIRPQSKQRKKIEEQRNNMKIGDEVVTAGGFYGIISAIDDENVVLEMLPDFHKLMIRKASIVQVVTPAEEAKDNIDDDDDAPEVETVEAEPVEASKGEDTEVEDAEVETVEAKEA